MHALTGRGSGVELTYNGFLWLDKPCPDAVGDGEKEACEARILNFLMQIGLWGIIAISIAMIMIGALGTILIQRVYDRHKKGRPERNEWMDKGGEQI